jgi:Flp pilus assembly pilin Flp
MLRTLFIQLWKDESGAVIATEYLMLGSIVAAGSASGMVAMRDSIIDEYKEFGQSTREIRQSYSIPAKKGGAGAVAGSRAVNNPNQSLASGMQPALTAQELQSVSPVP